MKAMIAMQDMKAMFDTVCMQYPPDAKLVFHGDGASINVGHITQEAIEDPIVPTQQLAVTTNIPYRADLMGVGKFVLRF